MCDYNCTKKKFEKELEELYFYVINATNLKAGKKLIKKFYLKFSAIKVYKGSDVDGAVYEPFFDRLRRENKKNKGENV